MLSRFPKEQRPELIYTELQIESRIAQLGSQISSYYQNKRLVLLGILTGSLVFLADLMRSIDKTSIASSRPKTIEIETVQISSYRSSLSPGEILLKSNINKDLFMYKHVLIIDDILDTGKTLEFLVSELEKLQIASIKTCVLLDKHERRKVNITPNFYGFKIDKGYVVGYGLDADGEYREASDLYVLSHRTDVAT